MKKYSKDERIKLDKFYTNEEIAYNLIKEYIKEKKYDNLFIEPSAGNGALLRVMDKLNLKYKAFDLYPEGENITKQDFLEFNISDYTDEKNIITFMNPPFGFSCNLADNVNLATVNNRLKELYLPYKIKSNRDMNSRYWTVEIM